MTTHGDHDAKRTPVKATCACCGSTRVVREETPAVALSTPRNVCLDCDHSWEPEIEEEP